MKKPEPYPSRVLQNPGWHLNSDLKKGSVFFRDPDVPGRGDCFTSGRNLAAMVFARTVEQTFLTGDVEYKGTEKDR